MSSATVSTKYSKWDSLVHGVLSTCQQGLQVELFVTRSTEYWSARAARRAHLVHGVQSACQQGLQVELKGTWRTEYLSARAASGTHLYMEY
jgi:hypothetical protein